MYAGRVKGFQTRIDLGSTIQRFYTTDKYFAIQSFDLPQGEARLTYS